MNASQRRDRSNEKIFSKVNLRQSSNDSRQQSALLNSQMSNKDREVERREEVESIKARYSRPNPMEEELANLQQKILDLEGKLG